MNRILAAAALAASALLTACTNAPTGGGIGLVDVQRVSANWPKFLNYQNQLNADVQTVQRSAASDAQKQRQMAGLQEQFQRNQTELTNDVRAAAEQVAGDRHLRYVLTRQFVGFGGVDITPDVERILKITERATPSP